MATLNLYHFKNGAPGPTSRPSAAQEDVRPPGGRQA
jgi:hypothetical protein